MRDTLLSARAGTETDKFLSACAIRVPVFPGELSSNFSSHSFRQNPKGPEWGLRSPAASWRRMAERSRAKIAMMGARALRFGSLKQQRTNQRQLSFVLGGHAEPKEIMGRATRAL